MDNEAIVRIVTMLFECPNGLSKFQPVVKTCYSSKCGHMKSDRLKLVKL